MKCKKIMNEFLELDNYKVLPLKMKVHFLFCGRCRHEAAKIMKELGRFQKENVYNMRCSLVDSIMAEIRPDPDEFPARISGIKWVFVGTVIFVSIFMVNYSNSYIWLKQNFGADIIIPMSLVLGGLFSIYLIILMGVNYSGVMKGAEYFRFFKKD